MAYSNRSPRVGPPMDEFDLLLEGMAKEFETTPEKILEKNPELATLYKSGKENPQNIMTYIEYCITLNDIWIRGKEARQDKIDTAITQICKITDQSRKTLMENNPELQEAYDIAKADATQFDEFHKIATAVLKEEEKKKVDRLHPPLMIDPEQLDKIKEIAREFILEKPAADVNKVSSGQLKLHDAHVQLYKSMTPEAWTKLNKDLTDKPGSNGILIEKKK